MSLKQLSLYPRALRSWKDEVEALSNIIKEQAKLTPDLTILEAGCGTKWGLKLEGVSYTLTGVDIDEDALDKRVNQRKDLDLAILGDLRTVKLEEDHYDVIFNSNVLEHVDGAEKVLDNFVRWLKPGGIILLLIPNRNSAKGFLTRITPFWVHVLFYKYMRGHKTAGKPGHAPFRTVNGKRSAARFDLEEIRSGKAEDPVIDAIDLASQ